MKKILLLLLLATFSIQAQTLQNPTYGNVKLKNNTTDNSATKVNVQSTDGTINTVSKSDLVNVVEVNDVPSLPLVGEDGKIYVVKNVNKIYRWNGTFYQELAGTDISGKINVSEKGAINGVATLGSDGKVPNSQIPALAISETFHVSSQAQMLALSQADQGDVAIRSDISKSFILRVLPSSVLGNWSELLTPTSAVTSVNGQVGVVTLSKSDVGLSNVDNTSDANKPVSTAQQTALNLKENAFSKNTAFNKNFGTTAGTVVEGGTLGSNAYTSTDFFRHTGTFTADANTIEANRTSFTYASNSPHNGNIIHFDAQGYGTQINTSYGDGNSFSFRTRNGDVQVWNPWRKVWHDGNFNPANYLPLTGGNLNGGLNGTSANFSSSVTATSFNGSATLTGTPTAPTATAGTNTTQIATTAFVNGGLATKENTFSKNTAFNKNFGTTAGTVVEGNYPPAKDGTGAFGTWGINISGSSDNSTLWNGYDISVVPTNVVPSGVLGYYNSGVTFQRSSATALSSFLGLGSNAYTSTAFLPLSGGTLTGIVTAPTATVGTNTTQIATTAFVLENSSARPYKVYTALLTQSGTSAPVATVLENTLGGTVVWTRTSNGIYVGTLAGVFTANKTFVSSSNRYIGFTPIYRLDSNIISLTTSVTGSTYVDNVLENNSVEIRVYN